MIRFWRRLKIAPGINLNFSKRGISTSVGMRGAHVTIGKRTTVSAGLPGSGVSVRETLNNEAYPNNDDSRRPHGSGCVLALVVGFVIILVVYFIGEIIAHA